MEITEITSHGEVTIAFNQPILMPESLPSFIPSNKLSNIYVNSWDSEAQEYFPDYDYFNDEMTGTSQAYTNLNSTHLRLKLVFNE